MMSGEPERRRDKLSLRIRKEAKNTVDRRHLTTNFEDQHSNHEVLVVPATSCDKSCAKGDNR